MALGMTDSPQPKRSAATTSTQSTLPSAPLQPPTYASTTAAEQRPLLPVSDTLSFVIKTKNITGDRKAILSSSHVLSCIVRDSQPVQGSYRIDDTVNAAEFEAIIKFFETGHIRFEDLDDALRKLEFGKVFLCPALVRRCVKDIDSRLTYSNVITVFRTIQYHVASASKAPVDKKTPLDKKTPEECLEALLHNVLQFIDQNADVVLQGEEILEANLSFSELEMMLRRDSLITSEVVIYNLLVHWSRKECDKRRLELTAENRRQVLGPLSYMLRYLRMSQKEFESACVRVDLLDPTEVALIQDAFKGKSPASLTEAQADMLAQFKRPRPKYARMPIHMSERSHPKKYPSKMRKYERTFEEENQCTALYWLCCCYAFVCD